MTQHVTSFPQSPTELNKVECMKQTENRRIWKMC